MTVEFSLGTGILAGIALFFILQRLGVIDKWIDRWDR